MRNRGAGEAVPVKLLTGEDRLAILSASVYDFDPDDDSAADQVLQCQRTLPPGAKVSVHIATGLATAIEGRAAVSLVSPISLDFTVRDRFSAQLLCERTKADAPCHPLLPIRVRFTADVPPEQLAQIRLRSESDEWAPAIEDDSDYVSGQSMAYFEGPFLAEQTLKLWLPDDFSDEDGRSLQNAESIQSVPLATADYPHY